MSDDAAPGGLLRIGILLLGLGLVSVPFWQGPLRLDQPLPFVSIPRAGRPCPSGVGVEPYCYDDSADSIGVGSDLLAQFFGVRRTDTGLLRACGTPVRAMIATLPDPTASHLVGDFDAFLYALSRAHEHVGFSIDRFRIEGDAPQAGRTDSSPSALRSAGPWAILFRRAGWLPGRADDTTTALSLVYLVGETPTAGLDKLAFRRALNDLARLRRACPGLPVHFIGPYFSGAVPSWGVALGSLGTNVLGDVTIVSGSATSPGNLAIRSLPGPRRIAYAAAVNSDSVYQLALDAMRGTLVFSSYSLIGGATGASSVDLFPSDAASGVYHATLIQLGHAGLVRYDRGLGIPWGRPCPPVWVTVVGAGVIAPLRAESRCDTAYAYPAPPSAPERLVLPHQRRAGSLAR